MGWDDSGGDQGQEGGGGGVDTIPETLWDFCLPFAQEGALSLNYGVNGMGFQGGDSFVFVVTDDSQVKLVGVVWLCSC